MELLCLILRPALETELLGFGRPWPRVPRVRRLLRARQADRILRASARNLATDIAGLGDHALARELDEDTLKRRRLVLGEEHPDTLATAHKLAIDLAALAGQGDPQSSAGRAARRGSGPVNDLCAFR
ncbi:MAG TPA: tetratricopeptide repeat protein [Nakamurella sp.]